jgi:hypothetical protein
MPRLPYIRAEEGRAGRKRTEERIGSRLELIRGGGRGGKGNGGEEIRKKDKKRKRLENWKRGKGMELGPHFGDQSYATECKFVDL